MKKFVVILMVLIASMGVLSAQEYFIQAKHSGGLLNIAGLDMANGARACQGIYPPAATLPDNFKWQIIPAPGGYFYLKAKHSTGLLNIAGLDKANGALACQGIYPIANTLPENFVWQVIPAGGEYFYLKAKHSGGLLNIAGLDMANGASACQGIYEPAASLPDNFRWKLIAVK